LDAVDLRRVQEARTGGYRFLCQRLVEIRPIPMRVGDLVVRTCRDEQLALVPLAVYERLVETMEEEGEAAFQPDPDVGVGPLPRSPFRECPDSRQMVSIGKLFQQEIGERRGRFANGEPGMPPRVPPAPPGDFAAAAPVRPASRQIPSRGPQRRHRSSRPARLS
jgi:hypothetical protein